MPLPRQSVLKGLALLTLSSLLFATMGVFVRLASHTVNNEMVVFYRNLTGTLLLLPVGLLSGPGFFRTDNENWDMSFDPHGKSLEPFRKAPATAKKAG